LLIAAFAARRQTPYPRQPKRYPDLDTLIRGCVAIGPLRRAVSGLVGGETVAELMRTAFERRTRPDGGSLTDDYRLLIAPA
jgi:hypothetical protein